MVRTRCIILAALAALLIAGCSTPPAPAAPSDPRNPDIYRPAKPGNYPLPR